MTRPARIGAEAALGSLPGWQVAVGEREAITRTYRFADFNTAFGFMTRTAIRAEQLDHHPEWFNVYNRVRVVLTTHDDGGLTMKDVELARAMNQVAAALAAQAATDAG